MQDMHSQMPTFYNIEILLSLGYGWFLLVIQCRLEFTDSNFYVNKKQFLASLKILHGLSLAPLSLRGSAEAVPENHTAGKMR